jgi:hypothetical protein
MTDLESCFDAFTLSAFRLETLPLYDAGDDVRFAAWRRGDPLPERSVRTSPWLRRIALTTVAGKAWQRVHVMELPLTEYERFELAAYVESAAAGEEIRIADRAASPAISVLERDFWLFDGGTPRARAALMTYDAAGRYVESRVTADPAVIRACEAGRDLALQHSVALNAYLAARRQAQHEAA